MAGPFQKRTWIDFVAPAISATNLNDLENRIFTQTASLGTDNTIGGPGGSALSGLVASGNPLNIDKVFYAALPPYNVKANGKTVSDAAITAGQATLSSASAAFTTADQGKLCVVVGAGTPVSATSSGATGVSPITSIPVNALASDVPPGGITISSGPNNQQFVTSGAKAGTTSIPLLPTYVGTGLTSALSTGAPITSLPVAALLNALPAGSVVLAYLDGSSVLRTQTFTTTGAAAGATSIPITSATPNYAYIAGTQVWGTPVAATPNFNYPSGSALKTNIPALSTTISSVAGGVATLAASAGTTVASGGECFYATDDTTGAQQCITDAAAVRSRAVFPNGDMGLSNAIGSNLPLEIIGAGCMELLDSSGGGATAGPSTPTYLEGSVFVMCAPNKDAISCAPIGVAQYFKGFGVRFAGKWLNTGHGLNLTSPDGSYGNCNGVVEDVRVYGQDANHYGFHLRNTMNMRLFGMRSYGGGGCWLDSSTCPNQPGNHVMEDAFFSTFIGGLAHSLYIDGSGTGSPHSAVLFSNVNAQVNLPNPAISGQAPPQASQQCIATTNGGVMPSMSFSLSAGQTQIGSKATYPWGQACFRTNDASNAPGGNPYPPDGVVSGTAYQNQQGTPLIPKFMWRLAPPATGANSTTLNGSIGVNATSIVVASATGYAAGQVIQIGDAGHDGGVLDWAVITSVAGTTLNLLPIYPGYGSILSAHSTGATVQTGGAVVYASINQSNSWPGYHVARLEAAIGSSQQSQDTLFMVPVGWWFRFDFVNASRIWDFYNRMMLG